MAMTSPEESARQRVAIVEDEVSIRHALAGMVQQLPGLTLVGSAPSVAEGKKLLEQALDLMLLDLGLSDGSGFELIDYAQRHAPTCKILVVSVFGDVRNVVRAIELGAAGYLLKTADLAQAGSAIELVLAGGAPISPAVAGHILQRIRKAPPSRKHPPELTARELEILEALAKGLSFKEVGQICALSHHTVGDHVKAIYRKLSVNSRGEAIFEAIQSGLIEVAGPRREHD
jgi:DNA-binding NarL/FixJ family response regulator